MPRLVAILAAALTSIGLLVALVWHLTYREAPPPARVTMSGLDGPADVGWTDDGVLRVRASTEHDAVAALGYAHGRQHTWAVSLWRQAALGRLSEWFGAPALPLDRLVHQLGLPDDARAAYADLDAATRDWLDAYGRGVAHGLSSSSAQLRQELVLLDVTPSAWEPWHALAIERLLSWLSTPVPNVPALGPPPSALDSLQHADHHLRRQLQLYGFEHSIAWVVRDTLTTHLAARYHYGGSAIPFLVETSMQWDDGPTITGASIPGTPFFPMAQTDEATWAILLRSPKDLTWQPWPASVETRHHRMHLHDATERLVTARHAANRLLLSDFPPQEALRSTPDSVLTLAWHGFQHTTDARAWRDLLHGALPSFRLIEGDGLYLSTTSLEVTGRPLVSESFSGGHFVGLTPWSRYAAERLATLAAEAPAADPIGWTTDAESPWAARLAPALLDSLAPPPSPTPAFEEALTYLLNWDFAYDRPSIGASIFDVWLTAYQSATGTLPLRPTLPEDTLTVDRDALTDALLAAIDTLDARFGSNMSRWRWERVQPERWRFPGWSTTSSLQGRLPSSKRFAPLDLPNAGHPTTLAWSASPILPPPTGPATWTAWTTPGATTPLTVRRRRLHPEEPLDRYLTPHRPPRPFQLSDQTISTSTTLVPLPD
ncbi:MAG: hypothetical protein GVY18_13600 [Bacteroidetes bacterium]|jgi:hypothetical protein|nr:hypothetical protein [Bacteroidota bacterium]